MTAPNINSGEVGHSSFYTQKFNDGFGTDGAGPGSFWGYDDLSEGLNRTGNEGQDANGTLDANQSVSGKRWAAYTNGNNNNWVYRSGGQLYIGGSVENTTDPTRENFSHAGTDYNWNNIKPYAPYMVHWGRVYDNASGGFIDDPSKPNIYFGPGHFIEIRLSVEQMKIPGFRVSLWLTPTGDNAGNAYDANAANGVEIDILEIENWINGLISGNYGNNRVQMKVLGGAAGSTTDQGGGNINAADHGFDITTGFHTFGLLWLSTGLYWYIDGKEVIRETSLVPQTSHYLSLTRELNSGVGGSNIPANGVKRPTDIGLFDVSAYPHLSYMDSDKAIVDYVRVWAVDGEGGTMNNPNFSGSSESPSGSSSGGGSSGGGTTGGGSTSDNPSDSIGGNTTTITNERDSLSLIGVDYMPDNDVQTFKPRLLESNPNPEAYTYSHSVSGDATIIGSSTDYELVIQSGSGDFTITSDVNLI